MNNSQVRNSNIRADIPEHADHGHRALQPAAPDILHTRGVERLFHHGFLTRGDSQDNRFAPPLLHRALEPLRLRAGASLDPRYPHGGHNDRFSRITDFASSGEGLQNRKDIAAHKGRQGYQKIALRPGRQSAGTVQHRCLAGVNYLHLRHHRHVRFRTRAEAGCSQ